MPRLDPFQGLRYDTQRAHLSQVIAPPYDVIDPAQRSRLAARHPANAVRVELPVADLGLGLDRYETAAMLLDRWQEEGTVGRDERPALYAYRMTSPDGGSSTGVIGALGLGEPDEETDILPHEETLPTPRSDRLELLRATRANLSPIWVLSLASGLSATFGDLAAPDEDVVDDDGVRHQLWVLDDPDVVAAVVDSVASAPVVVADGHHRYQTARTYQAERRAATNGAPGPYDQVMALVVELSEEQLDVGAIHRTIDHLPEGTELPTLFGRYFDVVRAGDRSERVISALGESSYLALIDPESAWLLVPREEAYEAARSDLDSSLVSLVLDDLPAGSVTHRHSTAEVVESLSAGEAQGAVLLRPVTVKQIARWADERRRMPPKTTFFRPKPRTGMVYRTLDDPN